MAAVEMGQRGAVDAHAPPKRQPHLRLARRANEIWRAAPGDLKLIAAVLPLLIMLVVNAASHMRQKTPRIATQVPTARVVDGFVSRQMRVIRDSIADRAGFDYADDFRSGLDGWQTKAGNPPNWGYDATGFIHPGVLALYRPSLQLSDYRFEFLTRLEKRALGAVFRARDANNYYGVKLVLERPGPLPDLHLVHFGVINGKEVSRVEKEVPGLVFTNAFLHVCIEVRGSGFTLMVNDKVADFWTDDRLKTGGIGFFCGRGEEARLRWVNVSYQYDTLGRVCAYLAPSSFRKNGS